MRYWHGAGESFKCEARSTRRRLSTPWWREQLSGWWQEEELDVAELHRHTKASDLAELKLDEPGKIGYVYKTFGSGILLLRLALRNDKQSGGTLLGQAPVFEKLVTELIMCGGDADTNACFAGALLGAHLGYRALPGHWKHGLRHELWLMGKSEALCQILGVTEGSYRRQGRQGHASRWRARVPERGSHGPAVEGIGKGVYI